MVVRIQDIVRPLQPLDSGGNLAVAFQRFQATPDVDTLAVTEEGNVVGILQRARLMDLMMSPIGLDILFRQPIVRFMDRSFETVDAASSISLVASTSSTLKQADPTAALVALEGGVYCGVVPLGRLLKAVARINLARARSMKSMKEKLAAAADKVARTQQDDNQFVALLGHEIRTPLTGILGVADLLCDTRLGKEQQALASTIVKSGHHLDRLLDDLLDLSRLKAGKVNLSPQAFDVREFARETRALWQARSDKNDVSLNVQIKIRGSKRIVADTTRLRQILFNLVSNAIKFSEGGKVDVRFETRDNPLGQTELIMSVADTGKGIAEQDKARMFEMFEQASPETRLTHGGTGLGLAIAKGLTDRMGGSISLEDRAEGGSLFTVTCPVLRAGPKLATENKRRKRSANFELGRLLVVDDHNTSRFVMTEALRNAGWSVDAVATATQAERRLSAVNYQAALFDLHLGETHGADLLSYLREGTSPNRFMPVLAVSADVGAERRLACQTAGFEGFVEKPVRPRQLVASLADIIVTNSGDEISAARLRAV